MAVTDQPDHRTAVELLREFGLKEYEAASFVALSRLLQATAKEISEISDVTVFVSGLEWLSRSILPGDETEISRLLLADREAILVSSFTETTDDGRQHEQGVFDRGFDNGLVAIVRRLMATGLLASDDPEWEG